MSNTADIKAHRGTKRTCQNDVCGSRFYDLNRDPITCPICNAVYVIDPVFAPKEAVRATQKPAKKPVFVPVATKPDAPEVEGEELVAIEGEEEVVAEDEEETFLDPDDDPSDVSGIIDTPIVDTDEKN